MKRSRGKGVDGAAFAPGTVYVAPPDHHMLVHDGRMCVLRGPKENRSRPAIDPLMRSAAVHWGSRVIGIVLTGYLDDGSAGLLAIKCCGGVTIAQSPEDAEAPQMPRNAIERGAADYVVPLAEMGALIERLVLENAPQSPPVPGELKKETEIMEQFCSGLRTSEKWGKSTDLACPECGGSLQEMGDEAPARYRCRVGHGFSTQSLIAEQNVLTERALWAGLRSLEEQAELLESLARRAKAGKQTRQASRYEQEAAESLRYAEQIRLVLRQNNEQS